MIYFSLAHFSRFLQFNVIIVALLGLSLSVNGQTLNDEATDIMSDLADVAGDLVDELESRKDYASATAIALELNVERILSFVGEEIAYVPYRGVLRGSTGTLQSRYGNSFDQSIALASLLNRAGYEAQVLVGADPTPQAPVSTKRTNTSMFDDQDIDSLYDEIIDLSAKLADSLGKDIPAYTRPETAKNSAKIQTAVLSAVEIKTPEKQLSEIAVEADLFAVVRYRSSPSENWQWFDPARNKAILAGDATTRVVLNDSVPEEQSHFVEIELLLETVSGEQRQIAKMRGAAANISGMPVELTIRPSEQARIDPAVAIFDPRQNLVVSGTGFNSMAVSLEGSIVEAEAMASGFGDVFQTGASLLGDALTTLESEGEVTQAPLLEKLLLRVSTGGPGVSPFQTERILFDGKLARLTLESRPDVKSLTDEQKDNIFRAQLLASVTGDYTVFTGVPSAGSSKVELDIAKLMVALSDDLVDGELNRRDFGNVATDMITAIIWRDLGEIFVETAQVAHVSPSFAMMTSRGFLGDDFTAQNISISTDILRDGRAGIQNNYAASLRAAITAAAMESTLVDRLGAVDEERFISGDGALERLEARLAEGVQAIDASRYLASLPKEPDNYPVALHRKFIESQIADGRVLTIWPGDNYLDSVWLEHDVNFMHARLGTGLGEGNELVEYMLMVNVVLAKLVINLSDCIGKKGDDKVKCIVCGTGKAALGVVGALGGPLIAVAAVGFVDVAAEAVCQ